MQEDCPLEEPHAQVLLISKVLRRAMPLYPCTLWVWYSSINLHIKVSNKDWFYKDPFNCM